MKLIRFMVVSLWNQIAIAELQYVTANTPAVAYSSEWKNRILRKLFIIIRVIINASSVVQTLSLYQSY